MKKMLSIITLLAITALIVGFVALGSTQTGLTSVRADGVEDSSSLATAFLIKTQGNFSNKSSTAWELPSTGTESAVNTPKFYFTTDGENLTFSAACVGYTATNGPAQLVCTIAATGGNQQVVAWPDTGLPAANRTWVDTIVITSRWGSVVSTGVTADGNNTVGELSFDGRGCKFFKWYVWDANPLTAGEAGSVSIWGSYY